jgi:hypothetical protein
MLAAAADDLRVLVSRDGALACLIEPRQILVTSLPTLARLAEVGLAEDTDVAIAGDYLVALARSGTLHVVDPDAREGPEKVGELLLEAGSRILACSGEHVLVQVGSSGAAFVAVARQPTLWRLPSRTAVGAGGAAAAADHFILVVGGVLEEWSAVSRSPLRRFRLDKPVAARFVGGGARHVWFVAEADLDHVVALPLAGAGRPQQIELPEPATRVAGDPSGLSLAIVGERTGAVTLVQLAERTATALHAGRVGDIAWRGAHTLVCTAESMIELVDIARPSAGNGQREPLVEAVDPRVAPALSTHERLAAWKERVSRGEPEEQADLEVVIPGPSVVHEAPVVTVHEWRDAIAAWTRRTLAGSRGEPPLLAAGPLYDVGHRLEISAEDAPFLWLVYGARLCGLDGLAPADLVNATPGRWNEALGRGRLAATGAFAWRRARVHLVPEIAAALDELPPRWGTIAASAVVAERTAAVVVPPDVDLEEIGAWAAPHLGPLLVPSQRGLAHPHRLALEARARGLALLVRAAEVPRQLAVIVVDDAAAAAALQLAVALTYS